MKSASNGRLRKKDCVSERERRATLSAVSRLIEGMVAVQKTIGTLTIAHGLPTTQADGPIV